MQPYLNYGYGFRSKNLPKLERKRLIDTSEGIFCWFYEDAAGSTEVDAGVFYILMVDHWGDDLEQKKNNCYPWAADINELIKFKEKHSKDVDSKLKELGLELYKDKLEFLVSVTEV
jgi:hypothetical protein